MAEIDDKESLARSQLPYRAEYCKTSRAKCKKCTESMEGGSLKIANMVKSRFHDGFDANYYHPKCFFSMKRPTTVAEIANFETLKYEDQKMLEKAIETNGKSLLIDSLSPDAKEQIKSRSKSKSKSAKREIEELVNYDDFLVEYAKSSRAKCVTCEQVITKGEIRFAKMDYAAETPAGFTGPVPRWHHKDCFAKSLEQLDFYGVVSKIPNFDDLEREDQRMLKKQIKPISPPKLEDVANGNNNNKKIKVDKEAEAEEQALKEQSARFYKLMGQIERCRVADIRELLKFNNQKHDINNNAVIQKLATDVLLFGPLKRCPKCKQPGTMLLRNSSYICTGEDCDYETRDPQRDAPDFPEEFTDRYEYFAENYEFKGGKRIFSRKFLEAVEQKEAEDNNLAMADAPLQGLDIGIITWNAVKNGKDKVQKKITTLGAKATTVMASTIFVILSNENELEKVTPKMEVAKDLGIPFARDDFLFNIKTREDVVPQLTKSLIGEWNGNLEDRFEKMSSAADEIKSE